MTAAVAGAPKKSDIAKALGVSPATITKCIGMGMPTSSIEAARAWRTAHIDPARSLGQMLGRDPRAAARLAQAAVAAANQLGALAEHEFDNHEPLLRVALRRVPINCRDDVLLPELVWARLIDVDRLRRWEALVEAWDAAEGSARGRRADPLGEPEAAAWLYRVASGETAMGDPGRPPGGP